MMCSVVVDSHSNRGAPPNKSKRSVSLRGSGKRETGASNHAKLTDRLEDLESSETNAKRNQLVYFQERISRVVEDSVHFTNTFFDLHVSLNNPRIVLKVAKAISHEALLTLHTKQGVKFVYKPRCLQSTENMRESIVEVSDGLYIGDNIIISTQLKIF